MNKHNLTNDELDKLAEQYEQANFQHEAGPVYDGSHLDAVVEQENCTVPHDTSKA